ncbi:MAG: polysaccharide deacetylase family protein [Bacteroidota bacterium]
MDVLLYTRPRSRRLVYIARYIFEQLLMTSVHFTSNQDDFRNYQGAKLNYSNDELEGHCLHLQPHTLLFEQGVKVQNIKTGISKECPMIFPLFFDNQEKVHPKKLAFDPFAAAFYLLTRYEEYLPHTKDEHGRYTANQSWAYQNDCLDRPMIWEWAQQLKHALQYYFPAWQPAAPAYRFLPTYDIDIPWAFRYRSWRGWGRTALELLGGKWPLLQAKWKVWTHKEEDPFFVFSQLKSWHHTLGVRPRVFWLLGDKRKHDINPPHHISAFRQLIKATSNWADLGIHPSYASFGQTKQIEKEKQRLEAIIETDVTHSRQHFLRMNLPQTYRQLLAAGIRNDYSMGYANEIGYRAGTSEPFFWYDLEQEAITELCVHPFVAMDVTLKNYLCLSPQQAQEKLKQLQNYCQQEQLQFCTLWHNSSFSELHGWSGWEEVYQTML